MKILDEKIQKTEILKKAETIFGGEMVKAVVDVERKIIGIDAGLHADIEQVLLENGSRQDDLWGINLYPNEDREDFVEFDSMINIRPRQGNKSRDVENPEVRTKIIEVVDKWIQQD